MEYVVNGQLVGEEVISQELARISRDPQWETIGDVTERAQRLRFAAEASAIDRILVEQTALRDPRPIDPEGVEQELQQQKKQWGCRQAFDDTFARQLIERQARVQRTVNELTAEAEKVTPEQVEQFFNTWHENLRKPETFRASHIVKHVTQEQTEEKAHAAMGIALAALGRGEPFAEVAARHSDCKENDGDLGEFPAGHMVEEFENVLRELEPGQRSGIFTTPFGFHIAMLHEKKASSLANFDDVREEIERVLNFGNRHHAYLHGITQLRNGAEIREVAAQSASV